MQKALYNGKEITISILDLSIQNIKIIREASHNNLLICPDKDCHQPLIFKCGEVKIPHFSHKKNCTCAYERYSKKISDEEIKLQNKLFFFLQTRFENYEKIEVDPKIGSKYYSLILTGNKQCIFQILSDQA